MRWSTASCAPIHRLLLMFSHPYSAPLAPSAPSTQAVELALATTTTTIRVPLNLLHQDHQRYLKEYWPKVIERSSEGEVLKIEPDKLIAVSPPSQADLLPTDAWVVYYLGCQLQLPTSAFTFKRRAN